MNRSFIPVMWEEALADSYLARMNACHTVLQREDLSEDGCRIWQTELALARGWLLSLGKRAMLRDGIYQLEKK